MPRFPVGSLADINLAERHGWKVGALYLHQDLDSFYAGSEEIPDPQGRRNIQQTLLLQAEFGLGERLALSGLLPVRKADAEGVVQLETAGLGDAEAVLRYSAVPLTLRNRFSLNLLGGVGLPTGRSDGFLLAQQNIQFGVGDFTGITGFETSFRLRPTISSFLRSQARFVLGANSDGYRFGDAVDTTAGTAFRIGASETQILAQVSTLHLEQDRQDGQPVPSRGGRWLYGSAGVRWGVGERGGVTTLLQRLIEVDARGDQLVSPWNLLIGYDFRIPGHTHPEPDPGAGDH